MNQHKLFVSFFKASKENMLASNQPPLTTTFLLLAPALSVLALHQLLKTFSLHLFPLYILNVLNTL